MQSPSLRTLLLLLLKAVGALGLPLLLHAAPAATNQVHIVKGVVRSIASDQRSAVIKHEAIPNYMPPMIMELKVRNPKEMKGIQPGDKISFRLVANETTHWIDTIQKLSTASSTTLPDPPRPARKAGAELKPGSLMPDTTFLSETGEQIRLSQFRGKAVAFTFIFTRCPLPDYCPRMGHNFSKARALLNASKEGPRNWQLLSISFDPEFDTPSMLAGYAKTYRGADAAQWLFVVASEPTLEVLRPQLDLKLFKDSGTIFHNLRTVVLDTQGRVHRQFDDSRWRPEDLAQAIREASAVPAKPAQP